jgi:hypothetical protein
MLRSLIAARNEQFGTPHFAEQFIDGREFNLSLLAGPNGPDVLPPAEIEFINFATGKPRIVGHDAKWNESTMEYINTPRRFDFPLPIARYWMSWKLWHVAAGPRLICTVMLVWIFESTMTGSRGSSK